MLWIALSLPQLPLDALLRSQPDTERERLARTPLVICEKRVVGWCNGAATEAGIASGMSEGNARALSSHLQVHPRRPEEERQALHEAALWALHFTPHVTLQPHGLLAEVAASLRLFGGRQRLIRDLTEGVQTLGMHAQIAYATTGSAAWLLAQSGPQSGHTNTPRSQDDARRLDCLPLSVMEQALPHLETLHDIGCRTLGQLRQLPRPGVVRRFGQALLTACDRAYGEAREAYAWFVAPTTFQARIELAARVDHAESLLFAARRLLLQLTGWLAARHAAAHALRLFLYHEPSRRRDHRHTILEMRLGTASRDPEHLTLLLREHLARTTLSAPVIELSLDVKEISAQAAPNSELFPHPAQRTESLGRLIERLQSRLGKTAVQQLGITADHRPERSVHCSSVHDGPTSLSRPSALPPIPRHAGMRPTWLLPTPLPLTTFQHKPYYQTPLSLLSGPERIEAGWWDDALAIRDYFIAENTHHVLYWIFRTRINPASSQTGWFLHGLFG